MKKRVIYKQPAGTKRQLSTPDVKQQKEPKLEKASLCCEDIKDRTRRIQRTPTRKPHTMSCGTMDKNVIINVSQRPPRNRVRTHELAIKPKSSWYSRSVRSFPQS